MKADSINLKTDKLCLGYSRETPKSVNLGFEICGFAHIEKIGKIVDLRKSHMHGNCGTVVPGGGGDRLLMNICGWLEEIGKRWKIMIITKMFCRESSTTHMRTLRALSISPSLFPSLWPRSVSLPLFLLPTSRQIVRVLSLAPVLSFLLSFSFSTSLDRFLFDLSAVSTLPVHTHTHTHTQVVRSHLRRFHGDHSTSTSSNVNTTTTTLRSLCRGCRHHQQCLLSLSVLCDPSDHEC